MRFRPSILIFLLLLPLAGVALADVPGDRLIPGDRPVVDVDDLATGRPLPGPLSAGDGGDSGDPFNDLARVLPLLVSQDAFESVYSLAADGYGDSDGGGRDKEGPLLQESPKDDLRIVSTEDGLLHLLNWETKKVVWSVNSGGPLYSAYQNRALLFGDHENGTKLGAKALVEPAPPEESHYVDFGNDGNLYVYTKIGKKRIGTSIETFISSTPHVSSEGIMTHGIRRQSFLKVDPITGQVLSSSLDNDLNTTLVMPSGGSQRALLSITRTDYELRGFYQDYNNTLWNMTFAKFDIYTFCSKDTHGLEYESDVASMFSCGMKIPVHALQINTQAPQILSLPSKDSLKNGEAIYSCEDGKSCLVKIDANGAQPVVGQPDFQIYRRVDWYLVFSVFVVLIVILLAIYLLKKRKWKRGEKVPLISNTGRKHRVAIKKKKNQKASSTGSPIVMTKKKDKFDNDNLQNHSHDSAQVGDSEFGDGIWVGELFVSNKEIAIGSNGTVVYEGIQDRHRKVAVKRMLLSHNEVAIKEIDNLILSDHHPNIVRFYKREQDLNFVYLSLERCTCSLNDMIQMLEDNPTISYLSKINIHIESLKGLTKDDFWQANGCPTSVLLNLMRDIVRGLAHLHQLGIVHRDLKPQNVLISQENTLRAKISDMGISKRLPSDMTSCHDPTGYGSSGWLAPEQIQHGRQTRAVDLFTLGCVLFFCVTGGKHPFGDRFERDMNITKNNVDLFLVEHLPEAMDLFSRLLNPNSELRPKANEVYNHPFFWDIGTRLSFLRDASDIIESEDKDTDSDILKAIEKIAPTALGWKWDEKLEAAFIDNIGRYRRYKYESVRDLLRVIRNKLNHYRDLPEDIQVLLGAVPGGFYNYFASRFPHLLIEVYKVIYKFCVADEEDHRVVSKFNKKKELEFIRKYFTWVV